MDFVPFMKITVAQAEQSLREGNNGFVITDLSEHGNCLMESTLSIEVCTRKVVLLIEELLRAGALLKRISPRGRCQRMDVGPTDRVFCGLSLYRSRPAGTRAQHNGKFPFHYAVPTESHY